MLDAGVVTAALAGLTGSLHCVAMCGGYVAASTHAVREYPLLPIRRLRVGQAVTHLGRLLTYVLLGFAFGAAGGVAFAIPWPTAQRILYVLANLLLIATAVRVARPVSAMVAVEHIGLTVFRRAAPLAGRVIAARALPGRFALGMLWGLTPCALIYGMLPLALLSGGAFGGASVMLGLWLGTLPALVLATGFAQRLATPGNRRLAAGVIALFGAVGLYRALFLPHTLAAGPFCWGA